MQAVYQTLPKQKCITKMCQADKFSKPTIAISFNLCEVCPSVPSTVFALLFYYIFLEWSDWLFLWFHSIW